MPSRRDAIVDALIARLNTGTPVGVPAAERIRTRQIEPGSLPVIAVYPGRETVETIGGRWSRVVKRQLQVQVECWATGPVLDEAVDPLLAWVTKALAGQQLGGLAIPIREVETRWEYQGGSPPSAAAVATYEIEYRTAEADQEQAG